MQKRPNPFEKKLNSTPVTPVEPEIEENEEEFVEPEPDPQPIRRVVSTRKPTVTYVEDENREKYTATMDIQLRRQIKIYCATEGIKFSTFIEDACRDKIRRNGGR